MARPLTTFNFLGRRRLAALLSLLAILASILSLATRGLNFGIDFTGGVVMEVIYDGPADLPDIRNRLAGAGFEGAQVQNFGAARDVLIRVLPQEGADSGDVGQTILDLLRVGNPDVELQRTEFVGPQVGAELAERGGLAMLFALILILAYIMFRFQWKFAVGAVAALIHDVIITVGVFSITGLSFDLSVLAAVLAVVGYSLNDTIVVFDRIRENFTRIRNEGTEAIMNVSLNQTLSRTIITGLTTLLVLFALWLLGGEAVYGFSVALIVGILVGTYSSVYIASAIALELKIMPADLMPPKVEDEARDQP